MSDPVYSKALSQGVPPREPRLCMPLLQLSRHSDRSLLAACPCGLPAPKLYPGLEQPLSSATSPFPQTGCRHSTQVSSP